MDKNKIIDKLYPLENLLGVKNTGSNFSCPFHEDRKPSAHFYKDSNSIFCFSEHRNYYVSDFIRKDGLNVNELFEELIEIYGSEEEVLKEYELVKDDKVKEKIVREDNEEFLTFTDRFFGSK